MFNCSENHRKYNLTNILTLAEIVKDNWLRTSILVTVKGKKEALNALSILKSIVDVEKTYAICGEKFTGEQILNKVEDYEAKLSGQLFPVIAEGRHRALALVISNALFGVSSTPETLEVTPDQARVIELQGNGAHDFITKLDNEEKFNAVLSGLNDGIYQKEADLPYKRGTSQKLFAQAKLVKIHGIPVEKVLKLNKEQARKALNATEKTQEEMVDMYLSKTKANAPKVMSGKDIREGVKLANDHDTKAKHVVTQILNAISNDQPMELLVIVQKALDIKKAKPEPKGGKANK